MGELRRKFDNAVRRAARTRSTIHGTVDRPRMSVAISNSHISVQLINDDSHATLCSATTVGSKLSGTMTEKASGLGAEIAKIAKSKKITKVVLDRGSRKYHGRIKALAEAARQNGLEF